MLDRSYYATPSELRLRPWALDFTPDESGTPAYPREFIVDPYLFGEERHLTWQTDDSDPALRFWTRPFDPNLTQWLESVDPDALSTMAALEFAGQFKKSNMWEDEAPGTALVQKLLDNGWLEPEDVLWLPDRNGFGAIKAEIEQLQQLMQDDRQRYLAEAEWQADGTADYFIHFLGATRARHPWTIELIACAMSISHIMHMHYKHRFNRVRPSFLCPGLVPPFGPPAHPSFPSGHSSQGHLIALLLLEIPGLAYRYGVFKRGPEDEYENFGRQAGGDVPKWDVLKGTSEVDSPLLWLAQRIAKNRERIGVHYPSDSSASRHLAAGIWRGLRDPSPRREGEPPRLLCPTLDLVIRRAAAEWPDAPK